MPATPIRLSDDQLTEVMRLSAPLQPHARNVFLRLLAHAFRDHVNGIGDGELFRTARDLIKAHRLFDAPLAVEEGSDGRRSRPSRGKYA